MSCHSSNDAQLQEADETVNYEQLLVCMRPRCRRSQIGKASFARALLLHDETAFNDEVEVSLSVRGVEVTESDGLGRGVGPKDRALLPTVKIIMKWASQHTR